MIDTLETLAGARTLEICDEILSRNSDDSVDRHAQRGR